MFNTLQRLGVPSRLLIFPSENHVRLLASPWLTLVVIPALVLTRRCRLSPSRARAVGPPPQNSLKWSEEVFRWLDEWCGGDDKAQQQRVEADASREGGAVEYSAGLFE